MQDIKDEQAYLARRERAERTLAMSSVHECARAVHLRLAALYSAKRASLFNDGGSMTNILPSDDPLSRRSDQIEIIRAPA